MLSALPFLEIGKSICDMHDGLAKLHAQCEDMWTLNHIKINLPYGSEIVTKLVQKTNKKCDWYYTNKLLVLIEADTIDKKYKFAYSYDDRFMGFVEIALRYMEEVDREIAELKRRFRILYNS